MLRKWELLRSQPVFESGYISIYQDKLKKPDGKIVENFFSIKRKDATYIVALTPGQEVLLVRQYKNGPRDLVWELPAGFVEENETPEKAAERELLEETGFVGENFLHLGSFLPNMGGSGNYNHYFLVTNVKKVASQSLDENEEIEVATQSLQKLISAVKARESIFIDSESQLALLLAGEEVNKK